MQELRQRIRDTYEARWKAEKHFNEEEILQELPGALRTQVPKPAVLKLDASEAAAAAAAAEVQHEDKKLVSAFTSRSHGRGYSEGNLNSGYSPSMLEVLLLSLGSRIVSVLCVAGVHAHMC